MQVQSFFEKFVENKEPYCLKNSDRQDYISVERNKVDRIFSRKKYRTPERKILAIQYRQHLYELEQYPFGKPDNHITSLGDLEKIAGREFVY